MAGPSSDFKKKVIMGASPSRRKVRLNLAYSHIYSVLSSDGALPTLIYHRKRGIARRSTAHRSGTEELSEAFNSFPSIYLRASGVKAE
jgi:hypothetical protein